MLNNGFNLTHMID